LISVTAVYTRRLRDRSIHEISFGDAAFRQRLRALLTAFVAVHNAASLI